MGGDEEIREDSQEIKVGIVAFFRDPSGDFAFREFKMKTDHENTKTRKFESTKKRKSNLIELARTRVKSRELSYDGKIDIGFESPMNYEEWSKSRELARTLIPDFSEPRIKQNGREDF